MKIRNEYSKNGVDNFYINNADSYKNPHEDIIKEHLNNFFKINQFRKDIKILDLCSGSGEVSRILAENNFFNYKGCDPYMNDIYLKNIGKECLDYSFKDLAIGKLKENFDLIICSFALHLADKSMLDTILYQLSLCTDKLVILTPHKKPEIKNFFNLKSEIYRNKVRFRYYEKSLR